MEDKELIEQYKRNLKASIEFFSNRNKKGRELWTIKEFLLDLGVSFLENELQLVSEEPPDVLFRDARFEVKELLDQGRRRHDEYKDALQKAESANKSADLFTPYTPKDIAIQEIVVLVKDQLDNINYSLDVCGNTDLLFYVNLQDCEILLDSGFVISEEKYSKWKSVSIVCNNKLSGVFWASPSAPSFLKSRKGNISIRQELLR